MSIVKDVIILKISKKTGQRGVVRLTLHERIFVANFVKTKRSYFVRGSLTENQPLNRLLIAAIRFEASPAASHGRNLSYLYHRHLR